MKILALDLGTHTGWCLGEAGKIPTYGTLTLAKPKEVKQFGLERTARTDDPRIRRLWKWVHDTCAREQPNVVIWEDVQFATYTFQVQLWSSLRTAAQLGARSAHNRVAPMVFDCVNVTTLKRFASYFGSAKKNVMAAMLRKKHPEIDISGCDDNAIDAIWLFKWAEHYLARQFKPSELKPNEPKSETPEGADQSASVPQCGEHDLKSNPECPLHSELRAPCADASGDAVVPAGGDSAAA